MGTVLKDKAIARDGSTRGVARMAFGDFMNVTWQMATPTLLGIAIGWLIDQWLGSSPAGFLIGAVIGFGVGIVMAVRIIVAMNKESNRA